jgi:hypothetical protein
MLVTMTGSNVGFGDTRMLQHTTKIDTSKVAHLNRDQTPQGPKPDRNAPRDRDPNALDQNERDQGQERSHGKDRSRNRPGKKVKCDRGYQDIPPQVKFRRLGENSYGCLKSKIIVN